MIINEQWTWSQRYTFSLDVCMDFEKGIIFCANLSGFPNKTWWWSWWRWESLILVMCAVISSVPFFLSFIFPNLIRWWYSKNLTRLVVFISALLVLFHQKHLLKTVFIITSHLVPFSKRLKGSVYAYAFSLYFATFFVNLNLNKKDSYRLLAASFIQKKLYKRGIILEKEGIVWC